MITIIPGTNPGVSNTEKVAKEYGRILNEKGIATYFPLPESVNVIQYDDAFKRLEDEILIPATSAKTFYWCIFQTLGLNLQFSTIRCANHSV